LLVGHFGQAALARLAPLHHVGVVGCGSPVKAWRYGGGLGRAASRRRDHLNRRNCAGPHRGRRGYGCGWCDWRRHRRRGWYGSRRGGCYRSRYWRRDRHRHRGWYRSWRGGRLRNRYG
jgi:hypothetical protein